MSDHDDFGSFLAGFVIGGVTGAIVALLFAPQSGEETRAVIKEKSIELHDKASKIVEEGLSKAEQVTGEVKKRASEVAEKGQVILEEGKERLGGKKPKPDST